MRLVACLVVASVAQVALAQAETVPNPALDTAFEKLVSLELGQDLQIFAPIQQAVTQSHVDAQIRTDLETRLIAVLHGNATDLAKEFACRDLAIVGADDAIPALAELLPNARLSHMARYALEGIGGPLAAESLREMLGRTEGRQQVGVVISLGRLADADSVSSLAALLAQENQELREVTLVALGRIGNVSATEALKHFALQAPAPLRSVVIDAELDAAESLCQQKEYGAAAELYESLQSADSERVRAAAFRGLIAATPTDSLTIILAGLAADEPWKRAVAADCIYQRRNPDDINTIASAVPGLPAAGQIAAFVSLKDRRQGAIRTAALKSLQQPNAEVRLAALAALIASATAEDVSLLADLATTAEDPAERVAAFETLRLMPATGTNQALLDVMNRSTELHPTVVRCALARRWPEFVPGFLQAAESPNADTRREAFLALEIMATPKEAEPLIRLLCKTSPGEEREAADRAVWMSCQQIADSAARAAPLLAAMEQADKAGQCAILPSLARMGGEKSLAAVHLAMHSPDQDVCEAGYRALSNWPDVTVASELLDIATSSEVPSYRIWSLRAYARLVSLPSERPPQATFEMLNHALSLATRTEDKELIITRLGSVRAPDALAMLLSFLDQAELTNAAVPSIFELAKGLSQSHPDQASAALEKIRSLTDDRAILQQIPKVLRDIEARKQGQNQ